MFVGVDVSKGTHYACALSASDEVFARPIRKADQAIRRLSGDAAAHDSPALVDDTNSSPAVLGVTVVA